MAVSRTHYQLGTDLLKDRGGIYQAATDYRNALGGGIGSVVSQIGPGCVSDPGISYFKTSGGPVGSGLGILGREEYRRLCEEMEKVTGALFLHGCFRLNAYYALEYAKKNKVPLYFVPHGGLDPWVFTYKKFAKLSWMRLVGLRVLREATGVLAMTKNELLKIRRFCGELENQHVIHLPMSTQQCVAKLERSRVRSKFGIPESARVLCFLGRLHEMKRPVETLEAVISQNTKIYLVMIGPDDTVTKKELQERARRAGASNRILIVGPKYGSEKYDILGACDAYVSLSHRENFNYTAVEAMSMGKPVILSPDNDLQGELRGVDCGWFLKSLNGSDIQSAFSQFENLEATHLFEMGQRGRAWVEENLEFKRFQRNLESLVDTEFRGFR